MCTYVSKMAKSCRRQLDKILSEISASDGDLSTEDESSSFEEDVATARDANESENLLTDNLTVSPMIQDPCDRPNFLLDGDDIIVNNYKASRIFTFFCL